MPLTEFMQGVFAGAAGSIVSDKVKDKMEQQLPHVNTPHENFIEEFPQLFRKLCENVEKLTKQQTLVGIQTSVNLFAYPSEYTIQMQGRQHVSLFTTTSFPIRLFVANAGAYQPTLNAGWNALDVPQGSTIALPQGTSGSQLVLMYYGENSMGSAI